MFLRAQHQSTNSPHNVIAIILRFTIIAVIILCAPQITLGQLTSLGRAQSFGGTPVSGGGGSSGGGANGNGGGGSGEILGPKSLPLSTHEPTCEELRAMWRFSKRQSRAAEITNEIPTYRDPFAYNVWEPYYPTTRSLGGMRLLPRYRDATRPVYGRVVHREPLARMIDRARTLDDISKLYGAENNKALEPRRRIVQFRFSGGGSGPNSLTPHHGSFQKLKELIWTERAKELAQQRKAEEMAARAAVLKDIANGQSYSGRRQHQQQQQPLRSSGGLSYPEENRSPDPELPNGSIISLPSGQKQSLTGSSPYIINPSSSSRSGGLLLPVFGNPAQAKSAASAKAASHFRERNRALFRQSATPLDYFQRESRNRDDGQINNFVQQLQQLLPHYPLPPSDDNNDDDDSANDDDDGDADDDGNDDDNDDSGDEDNLDFLLY